MEIERRENKLKINRIIKISAKEAASIHYIEENEIIYEGRLYDIVYKKASPGFIEFHCYLDVDEETAFKTVGDLAKKNVEQKINDLSIPFIIGITNPVYNFIKPAIRNIAYMELNQSLLNAISEIPDPPPDLFS